MVQLPGVTCILHPTGRADPIVLSRVLLHRLLHRVASPRYHGAPSSVNFRIQSGTCIGNFFRSIRQVRRKYRSTFIRISQIACHEFAEANRHVSRIYTMTNARWSQFFFTFLSFQSCVVVSYAETFLLNFGVALSFGSIVKIEL